MVLLVHGPPPSFVCQIGVFLCRMLSLVGRLGITMRTSHPTSRHCALCTSVVQWTPDDDDDEGLPTGFLS